MFNFKAHITILQFPAKWKPDTLSSPYQLAAFLLRPYAHHPALQGLALLLQSLRTSGDCWLGWPWSGGLCGSVSLLLLRSGCPLPSHVPRLQDLLIKPFHRVPAILLSSYRGSGSGRRHRDQIQAWAGVGEDLPMPSWRLLVGKAQWVERPMNEANGKVTIHKTSKNKPQSKTAFFPRQFEDGLIYRKRWEPYEFRGSCLQNESLGICNLSTCPAYQSAKSICFFGKVMSLLLNALSRFVGASSG